MSLLSLPPELRLLIYSHLEKLKWPPVKTLFLFEEQFCPPISQACRVLRYETLPLFFRSNQFDVALYYDDGSCPFRRSARLENSSQSPTPSGSRLPYYMRRSRPRTKAEFFGLMGPEGLRAVNDLRITYFWDREESLRRSTSNACYRASMLSFQIDAGTTFLLPGPKPPEADRTHQCDFFIQSWPPPYDMKQRIDFAVYEDTIVVPALQRIIDLLCSGDIVTGSHGSALGRGISTELVDTVLAMANAAMVAPKRMKRVYQQKCAERSAEAKEWRRNMKSQMNRKLVEAIHKRHVVVGLRRYQAQA